MNGTPILRLFGTTVYLNMWFLLLVGFISYSSSAGDPKKMFLWGTAMIIGVLVHEFGHVFAFRRYGIHSRILLWGMGGMAIPDAEVRKGPAVVVSLAGPFAGFALWAIAWFLFMPAQFRHPEVYFSPSLMFSPHRLYFAAGTEQSLAIWFWASTCWINLIYGFFNLMPLEPLDGGHALKNFLRTRMRSMEADTWTARVGVVAGVAATLYFLSIHLVMAALICGYLGFQNFEKIRRP